MDAYEKSNAYAQQRAAAEVGAPYKAGCGELNWYRWNGSRPCGSLERGAMMESAHHEGLQVWDREQWHPVETFGCYTEPMPEPMPVQEPVQEQEPDPYAGEWTRPRMVRLSAVHLLRAAGAMAVETMAMLRQLEDKLYREVDSGGYPPEELADRQEAAGVHLALAAWQTLEDVSGWLKGALEHEGQPGGSCGWLLCVAEEDTQKAGKMVEQLKDQLDQEDSDGAYLAIDARAALKQLTTVIRLALKALDREEDEE